MMVIPPAEASALGRGNLFINLCFERHTVPADSDLHILQRNTFQNEKRYPKTQKQLIETRLLPRNLLYIY